MEADPTLKIMELALQQKPRPFESLVRGKPLAQGREAVAALSGKPLLIQAALYLCFDCFEEAHQIANDHEGTVAGNWTHAILHRREPDAGNSKYWYARVKVPAKLGQGIAKEALRVLGEKTERELEDFREKLAQSGVWEPEAFVDACEKFRKKDPRLPAYGALARVQETEWKGLVDFILSSQKQT